jgi:hypothetical protein
MTVQWRRSKERGGISHVDGLRPDHVNVISPFQPAKLRSA